MHTTEDESKVHKAEGWLSKKSDRAKATLSEMGRWTDDTATEVRSNLDQLIHKYNIQHDLSDTLRDVVQKIKTAIQGQKAAH